MLLLKKRSTRFYLGFFVILALTIGGSAMAAFADTTSGTGASVAVTGGSLSEAAPTAVAAASVTLDGNDKTTTYALPLTINDPRGTGGGWNLTIGTTPFVSTDNTHTPASIDSSITSEPGFACLSSNNHCTAPVDELTYNGANPPLPYPLVDFTSSTQKFYGANANSGLGKFTVTPTVTLSIPANTLALTYSAIVTVTLNTGP